ncbi:class I SAM-dependent methyltransferase [Polynucleobacter sp. JS-Safj-400b-B2]|uniref:class I SAM-dependent methyltransferase n=1 Tax=Polynucleobacter sp. JS-Safj-400b-B2 TaxID=2576921 RepID=UPI001C0C41F0|nr:class I SAM-dependent methyltransferase [Polynucleobacter sp. JS-Safj-400b-B2]
MLTPDEITLAYQLLLGRKPENPELAQTLLAEHGSLEDLRQHIMGLSEFAKLANKFAEPAKPALRHPFGLPAIPVEVDCSQKLLDRMFLRIAKEWQFLGESNPYWSVITQPAYDLLEFEKNRDQFYSSGKHTADIFLASLRRCRINPNELKSCIDFGCGVGRVSGHLASIFSKVIAVDISQAHLSLAAEYAKQSNINNIEFVHADRIESVLTLPKVDAILSVITLQHNPPPVINWLIENLLTLLNPGGVAYLQLPSYRNGYLFEVERYLNTPETKGLEMHFLPQDYIFRAITNSGCICLEVREDTAVGDEYNMLSNSFVIKRPA